MTAKDTQFWQITISPLPEGAIGNLILTQSISLGSDKKCFPNVHGFSLVNGYVPRKAGDGIKDNTNTFVYHGALKIHGWTKRRTLREKIRSVLAPSVQVEVRGLAGWDRLCKRIFSEGFGGHYVVISYRDQERHEREEEEYELLLKQFWEKPDRQRRRNLYGSEKRG
jgi:hypothetical protein